MLSWLLTNTTYGTWLPGDPRGSVTSVRERRVGEEPGKTRHEHDKIEQAYEAAMPGLQRAAAAQMKGPPVLLNLAQATALLEQFQETADHRCVTLKAVAIMANHFHIVATPAGDPDPSILLGDFKSYGSRTLNMKFGRRASGTWWTGRGSKRKLPNKTAIATAINYVLNKQPNPLVTWSPTSNG